MRLMPTAEATQLDRAFHALADESRRAMVVRLSRGAASVSELAAPLDMSLPSVMQHLDVLQRSGVVRSEKVGRVRTCRLEPGPMRTLEQWIAQHPAIWERHFDRLSDVLDDALPPAPRDREEPLRPPRRRPRRRLPHRPRRPPMSIRQHDFTIERRFRQAPAQAFRAFADPELKQRWFGVPEGWSEADWELDFRVGGREVSVGRDPHGALHE